MLGEQLAHPFLATLVRGPLGPEVAAQLFNLTLKLLNLLGLSLLLGRLLLAAQGVAERAVHDPLDIGLGTVGPLLPAQLLPKGLLDALPDLRVGDRGLSAAGARPGGGVGPGRTVAAKPDVDFAFLGDRNGHGAVRDV